MSRSVSRRLRSQLHLAKEAAAVREQSMWDHAFRGHRRIGSSISGFKCGGCLLTKKKMLLAYGKKYKDG